MKRSARLEEIAKINLGFENIAGASLNSITSQFQIQENQLKQLRLYKEEYQDQLNTRLKSTVSAREMSDYQYFFASLDKAITQQTEIVNQWAVQLASSKTNWLSKKREVNKMSRAADKLRKQESEFEAKQEQKELDDMHAARTATTRHFPRHH
jgi:flagellar export protein FliJ